MNDDLYQVPLAEFTATRDALAARLKAAGDKAAADDVKRARKPSVPAWAANQVVWHAPDLWERMQTATRTLRQKHADGASAEELRQVGREQREALQAGEARAAQLLAQHGHAASPAVLQKVAHTLLALAHGVPGATPGRLDHELPAPGFEALAGLTLAAPPSAVAASAAASPVVETAADGPPALPVAKTDGKAAERERARRRAEQAAAEERQAASRRAVLKARARLDADEKRRAALEEELTAARRASDEARRELEDAEAEQAAADAALQALRVDERGR